MKINLNILIGILFLIISTSSLTHPQHNYDPSAYEAVLEAKQTQLKEDLLGIKTIYERVDNQLVSAATQQQQEIALAQGLADEREAILNIKKYLNIPFNKRVCSCLNLTTDTKNKIGQLLTQVSVSLEQLQEKVEEDCEGCAQIDQITTELTEQKTYLSIMKDTVESKCCEVKYVVFVDNLEATNVLYSGLTPEEYKQLVQGILSEKYLDYEEKPCPVEAPFANLDQNKCEVCTSKPVFNLKSRACQECPVKMLFNYLTKQCDADTSCPDGETFSFETSICEVNMSPHNVSSCPSSLPVWNSNDFSCHKCPEETPLWVPESGDCTVCPDEYEWDSSAARCRHQNCQSGQVYDSQTGECGPEGSKDTEEKDETAAVCPFETPFWDPESKACTLCPLRAPYFNKNSHKCEECAVDSVWNKDSNICECVGPDGNPALGTIFDKQQNRCVAVIPQSDDKNYDQSEEESEDQKVQSSDVGICPPEKPVWDDSSKSCQECPQTSPYWSEAQKSCISCDQGQVWNKKTQQCEQTKSEQVPRCPENTVQIAGECKKKVSSNNEQNSAVCPPQKPYYDADSVSCQECPQDTPFYDEETSQCVEEPQQGKVSSSGGVTCPPSQPLWDEKTKTCSQCAFGTVFDSTSKQCVLDRACQEGEQFDEIINQCRQCYPWEYYNTGTRICDSICEKNQYYDSKKEQCIDTVSFCSPGLVYDRSQLRCHCGEGDNFKYNAQEQKCNKECVYGVTYDELEDRCME